MDQFQCESTLTQPWLPHLTLHYPVARVFLKVTFDSVSRPWRYSHSKNNFMFSASSFSHKLPGYQGMVLLVSIVLVCDTPIQGQENEKTDTLSPKVSLRWKFLPDQLFLGKIASGIRTLDNYPQHTTDVQDFQWSVQSVDENGNATVKVALHRSRFRHRSDQVKIDYDSIHDAEFSPSEKELSEIDWILKSFRRFHENEYLFRFSDRGEMRKLENYPSIPAQLIDWPELPEQPVGVGDTWIGDRSQDKPIVFELVRLEEFDGENIAWIENKSNTMRYRFLVHAGRYLDNVGWDILSTPPEAEKQIVQHRSQRLRLELSEEKGRFDRLIALQPNQPGRALNLVSSSYKETDSINESLIGEKGMLRGIQERLWIEHVDQLAITDKDRWNTFDRLLFARYFQRQGDIESYRQLIKEGAQALAIDLERNSLARNFHLLEFAVLLASLGEFDAARQACFAIPPDASSGLSITIHGPVEVPKSALRDYALFLVAKELAKSGVVGQSTATAQMITSKPDRSAAFWVISMHLAEQGRAQDAVDHAAKAQESYVAGANALEFDTNGPLEVPIHEYRTLALGKLAICQAKLQDEKAMRKTLSMLMDRKEKIAVLVDLITTLDKDGLSQQADKLSAELSKPTQSLATSVRISMRLKSNALAEAERMIESISDPQWNAASRIQYALAIRFDANRANDLQKQLDLAGAAIREISDPGVKARVSTQYAGALFKTGRNDQAQKELNVALELVERSEMEDSTRSETILGLAEILPRVPGTMEFEKLLARFENILNRQQLHGHGAVQHIVVNIYLERGEMEKAETLAKGIEEASSRCQALSAIGSRYGKLLELERSREVFSDAYESAMQVIDVLGLDTVGSKGGAVRFVGQQQGECDLEGLVHYLQASRNANIRAYGFLGGAEAIDPQAANTAMRTARIPEGILKEICESNVACKILQKRAQLLETLSETAKKDRP